MRRSVSVGVNVTVGVGVAVSIGVGVAVSVGIGVAVGVRVGSWAGVCGGLGCALSAIAVRFFSIGTGVIALATVLNVVVEVGARVLAPHEWRLASDALARLADLIFGAGGITVTAVAPVAIEVDALEQRR